MTEPGLRAWRTLGALLLALLATSGVASLYVDDPRPPAAQSGPPLSMEVGRVPATRHRIAVAKGGDLQRALDQAAPGDLIELVVFRDSADGADTCTVDAELVVAAFEYTTS